MNDIGPKLLVGFSIAGLVFVLGLTLGELAARKAAQQEAVKAGVAEFRATPEGDVTFHWKEPKP